MTLRARAKPSILEPNTKKHLNIKQTYLTRRRPPMFKWLRDFFTGDFHKEPEIKKDKLSDHVTHWSNKSFAAPTATTAKKPFGTKPKATKSHTKAQLSKKTKVQLE